MDATANKLPPRPTTPKGSSPYPEPPQRASQTATGRGGNNPFDAVPPHDNSIERCVLGSMLCARYACEYALAMLVPEHFYIERNRYLFVKFSVIYRTHKALDEKLAGAHFAHRTSKIDEIRDTVGKLIMETPTASNIEGYVDSLLRLAQDRKRWDFALRIIKEMTVTK